MKPGDNHYRAYVGPPDKYDLVAANAFNCLTAFGLRGHHTLLDIGCGSLRVGRLLIPYLDPGNYFGVEPNYWLVRDGIKNEIGFDQLRIKEPRFSFNNNLDRVDLDYRFDYVLAHSIFTHCGSDLLSSWLGQICFHLRKDSVALATVYLRPKEKHKPGWNYPDCTYYSEEAIQKVAYAAGLHCKKLPLKHPNQQRWFALHKGSFNRWPTKVRP
jgi:SAM-dependent methyltransferase